MSAEALRLLNLCHSSSHSSKRLTPSERVIYLMITITTAACDFIAQSTLVLLLGISWLYVVVLIIKLALCIYRNLGALAAIHDWA